MVVCNFYDFLGAVDKGVSTEELIEAMDIGGPTLVRAAAKNYTSVAVVVDPADYSAIVTEITECGGISLATRQRLAVKAIRLCADYDTLIASTLGQRLLGEETQTLALCQGTKLRYGENPDQEGWVYRIMGQKGIAGAEVLGGKALSYNNYEDAHHAHRAAQDLWKMGNNKQGVAIIKHGGLCGYAYGGTAEDCFERAWMADDKSAFGSVIAFTQLVQENIRTMLKDRFVELLIAPDFTLEAQLWLKEHRPRLRLLKLPFPCKQSRQYRSISGGVLVQTPKDSPLSSLDRLFQRTQSGVGTVSSTMAPREKWGLFLFAQLAVCHTKSNAVVIARESSPGSYETLSIGAGQPNRVDSLERLALPKAFDQLKREFGADPEFDYHSVLADCVLASDGFFPFADSIASAAAAGIGYCIQPGGSLRDQEVTAEAERHGMCMVLSGNRAFTH